MERKASLSEINIFLKNASSYLDRLYKKYHGEDGEITKIKKSLEQNEIERQNLLQLLKFHESEYDKEFKDGDRFPQHVPYHDDSEWDKWYPRPRR
jgi:hypothetical protein